MCKYDISELREHLRNRCHGFMKLPVPLTVRQNKRCDQCDDCQTTTLMGHKQIRRNNVLVLPGSVRRFCSNIPQLLFRPPDICTIIHDTNNMSCAGSPYILTLYPVFILNISINMTDETVSKLEWFMCRPPYHAKYQGEKRRKRMFFSLQTIICTIHSFSYNVKTGGFNCGGFLPTLCGTHTHTRLLVHSLAGTKY